jgi:hypothetical protein
MKFAFRLLGSVSILLMLIVSAVAAPLDNAQIETASGLRGPSNGSENLFKVSAARDVAALTTLQAK